MNLVCGVGINDADYVVKPTINGKKVSCPFYRKWRSMIERCYSDKFLKKRPTYIGCTVDPIWKNFMAFRSWMMFQDWEGKQLDKDIIEPGNKIYSPETCAFVSGKINNLLLDRGAQRGPYPQGVYLHECGRFNAQYQVDGKRKNLGYFSTPEEASMVYKKFKSAYVLRVAGEQTDSRIRDGLRKHARLIRNRFTFLPN